MRVSDVGEFGLIRRIAGLLSADDSNVIVGIGDDVAVLKTSGPDYLLATCDAQVESVHFLRESITPYQLGRKAVAINVSDVAAMGGAPVWGLVSLAIPPDLEVAYVEELYRGMGEEIRKAGGTIVGGNTSKSQSGIVIDFFLMGRVAPDRVVLRSGARPGDLILVTGTLGDSRAGLEVVRRPDLALSAASRNHVVERHLTPVPRLREGETLAATGRVHAMVDVSDGLVSDLGHICRASGVGAEIEVRDVPVSGEAREVAEASGMDVLQWALTGGEDYELLFTAAPEHVDDVQRALEKVSGTRGAIVGRVMEPSRGIRLLLPDGTGEDGSEKTAGWDHFPGKQARALDSQR